MNLWLIKMSPVFIYFWMPRIIKYDIKVKNSHMLINMSFRQLLQIHSKFYQWNACCLNNLHRFYTIWREQRLIHFIHAVNNLWSILDSKSKYRNIHVWSVKSKVICHTSKYLQANRLVFKNLLCYVFNMAESLFSFFGNWIKVDSIQSTNFKNLFVKRNIKSLI